MSAVQVVPGFSVVNRWLLYTSFMLAPAQFVSGIGSHLPTNLGFLAYNLYTQIQWYRAIQSHQLHALSMVVTHFNLIYTFTYLGGVTSGNLIMAIILSLGTGAVLVLNAVSAWTSWVTLLPEGFKTYQFFFFGWRILDGRWHKFFLLWQIVDSLLSLSSVISGIAIACYFADMKAGRWYQHYPVIPIGAALVMLFGWPTVLWTELIIGRNHIESDTDMVAVGLFIAQVGTLLMPNFSIGKDDE